MKKILTQAVRDDRRSKEVHLFLSEAELLLSDASEELRAFVDKVECSGM